MLSTRFIKHGVIYALIGMALGLHMGGQGDFTLSPVHAHLNLLGYVSMFLYGFYYKLHGTAAETSKARAHFWLANIGLLVMILGLGWMLLGHPEAEPIVIAGSVLTFLSMALFGVIIWSEAKAAA